MPRSYQMPKEKEKKTTSNNVFLSDFGKLYMSLSKEQREAALKEVGRLQSQMPEDKKE
jgi:hypothetical protein